MPRVLQTIEFDFGYGRIEFPALPKILAVRIVTGTRFEATYEMPLSDLASYGEQQQETRRIYRASLRLIGNGDVMRDDETYVCTLASVESYRHLHVVYSVE